MIDRRTFLNFAVANTVATAIRPLETEQSKKQGMAKSATAFAFQQVDVFSSKPLFGNPLAVVIGADALRDDQMAAFASWTNLSETTFLLEPKISCRGLSGSHLQPGAGGALCRPPYLRQLSRLVGHGRSGQRQGDRAGVRAGLRRGPEPQRPN